jgi:VIT1/CCC1 family predicted Fe2+/Mn2+ transporter
MSRLERHPERHLVARIGWLRAAVLGANDGLVSTASLVVGVAAAEASRSGVLIAGVAGLVAGAMSMAAGEYVSVSSQSDTEKADLARETAELAADPEAEVDELAAIYAARGVEPALARQVAEQLMTKDALGAHARDELGISDFTTARPVQAALTSALTFAAGAAPPTIFQAGQVRHLPYPLLWKACWKGCPAPGTYQNGAYWATPLNWVLPALQANGFGGEAAGIASAAVASFQAGGVMECVNAPLGYHGVRDYVASATNLLGVVEAAAA